MIKGRNHELSAVAGKWFGIKRWKWMENQSISFLCSGKERFYRAV